MPKRRTLTEELEELERTNPEVKKAADTYALTVRRILRKSVPSPSPMEGPGDEPA